MNDDKIYDATCFAEEIYESMDTNAEVSVDKIMNRVTQVYTLTLDEEDEVKDNLRTYIECSS